MRCCQCRCGPIRLAVQLPGSLGSLHLIYHSPAPDPLSPNFLHDLHFPTYSMNNPCCFLFRCNSISQQLPLPFQWIVHGFNWQSCWLRWWRWSKLVEGQCSRVLKCLGNGSATLMARMCPPQVTDTKLSQIYNPLPPPPSFVCILFPFQPIRMRNAESSSR